MFLVGTEFRTELFRSRARSAASVSVAGMVTPFVAGGILAIWLCKVPGLFHRDTAWRVLAVVLASFGGGPIIAIQAIAGGLLYAVLALTIGRKLLKHLGVIAEQKGKITPGLMAVTLMLLMLGSWTTDAVGIHSVFGGFALRPVREVAYEVGFDHEFYFSRLFKCSTGWLAAILSRIRNRDSRRQKPIAGR